MHVLNLCNHLGWSNSLFLCLFQSMIFYFITFLFLSYAPWFTGVSEWLLFNANSAIFQNCQNCFYLFFIIMCLMYYWQIIVSIIVSLLILTIAHGEIKGKLSKLLLFLFIGNIIMCLMYYWQIIVSIIVSLLILRISHGEIKGKLSKLLLFFFIGNIIMCLM